MRTLSTAEFNRWIEIYLRELTALALRSPLGLVGAPLPVRRNSDGRLVRMMELSKLRPFRFVRPSDLAVVLVTLGGRAFVPRQQRIGWVEVPVEGEVRRLKSREVAQLLGLTHSQCERAMTRGREAICHALIEDMDARRERGEAAA